MLQTINDIETGPGEAPVAGDVTGTGEASVTVDVTGGGLFGLLSWFWSSYSFSRSSLIVQQFSSIAVFEISPFLLNNNPNDSELVDFRLMVRSIWCAS